MHACRHGMPTDSAMQARKPLLASLIAASVLAAATSAPRPAEATATGVLRCQMPDGTTLYTNQGCGAFGARSAPITADLANRIVSERRLEARLGALRNGEDPDVALDELQAASVASAPSTRRDVSAGCARTPAQLARDLQASMAMRDVNRVAESFDWQGMPNRDAQRVMDGLVRLAEHDLIGAEYFDAALGPASQAGVLQVTLRDDGAPRIDDFEVTRASGCYFLRYA